MGKEVLSTNIDGEVLIQEGVEDLDLDNYSSPAMTRREAIRTLSMGVLAAATLTAPNLARADENADKEAERKQRFEMIKEIGLMKIQLKENFNVRVDSMDTDLYDLLKLKFDDNDSFMFVESYTRKKDRPYDITKYSILTYGESLDTYFDLGYSIDVV